MAKKLVYPGEIGDLLVRDVYKGGWSELWLCSDGGDIYCCQAVVDYLLAHEKKVIAVGACMSSATAIVACGSPALCSPSTRFMVHFSNVDQVGGRAHEMRNHADELQLFDSWYLDLLEARTKTGRDEWRELCEAESHFGAKVALELGLVDEIL